MSEDRGGAASAVIPVTARRVSVAVRAGSGRWRMSALVLLAAVMAPAILGQSGGGAAKTPVPFIPLVRVIQLVQADSLLGLRGARPDSLLVDIGALAGGSDSVLDSLQGLVPFEVSANKYRDCSDGLTPGAAVSRARCALEEYQHYVEVRSVVVRDSAAEATILVARRAMAAARGRGARQAIASTLGKAIGKRTARIVPVSVHTYVVRLTLTDSGECVAGGSVMPMPADRRVPTGTP